jgi:hypothetical protein
MIYQVSCTLQSPLEFFERTIREDIQKVFFFSIIFFQNSFILYFFLLIIILKHEMNIPQIWDAVPKPQAHVKTPVSDFFNVR